MHLLILLLQKSLLPNDQTPSNSSLPHIPVLYVFTPDGDGANDIFFISTKNATNVELTILNRWGHKMFEGSSLNPAWNGKAQNGSDAIDGVYFYKYTVYGPNNQQVEGEGFLQLVR